MREMKFEEKLYSSFLLLVAMPFAPSGVLAPTPPRVRSRARKGPSSLLYSYFNLILTTLNSDEILIYMLFLLASCS